VYGSPTFAMASWTKLLFASCPPFKRDTHIIWLPLLFSVPLSLLLLLTPMCMQYPIPEPTGHTVLACLRQHIWRFFYRNMADPRIFSELRCSSICAQRGLLAYGYPVDLNIYIIERLRKSRMSHMQLLCIVQSRRVFLVFSVVFSAQYYPTSL
jgi:hypothetical protein